MQHSPQSDTKEDLPRKSGRKGSIVLGIASACITILVALTANLIWEASKPVLKKAFPNLWESNSGVYSVRDSAMLEIQARGLTFSPRLWSTAFQQNDWSLIGLLETLELEIQDNQHDAMWTSAVRQKEDRLIKYLRDRKIAHSPDALCKFQSHDEIMFLVGKGLYQATKCESGTIVDSLIVRSKPGHPNVGSGASIEAAKQKYSSQPTWAQNLPTYITVPSIASVTDDIFADYHQIAKATSYLKNDRAAILKKAMSFCMTNNDSSSFNFLGGEAWSEDVSFFLGEVGTIRGAPYLSLDIRGRWCEAPNESHLAKKCDQFCISTSGYSWFDSRTGIPPYCWRSKSTGRNFDKYVDGSELIRCFRDNKLRPAFSGGKQTTLGEVLWVSCGEYTSTERERVCRSNVDELSMRIEILDLYADYYAHFRSNALAISK